MKNLKIVFTLALVAILCMPVMAQKSAKAAKKELMSSISKMDQNQQKKVLQYARNMEQVNIKKALTKALKSMTPENRQKLLDYTTQLNNKTAKANAIPNVKNKVAPKTNAKKPIVAKTAPAPSGPLTKVEVLEASYDFGVIKQGEKAQHVYKIKNVGKNPLVISKAKGSCGCTVPKWPKDPIAPGEIAEIDVVFNSRGKKGKQNKRITITANTEPVSTILTIKGEVKMPETPAKKPAPPVKE